jgi:uncharacterized protein YeaO (DUF488 family)
VARGVGETGPGPDGTVPLTPALARARRRCHVTSVPIRTRRWNDPPAGDDGFRVLVCRYRPRGVPAAREPWHEWWPELGPSRELHAAYWGKAGAPITFQQYRPRYHAEMQAPAQVFRIRALADRAAAGETVTLLCSSACTDPERCHRTLLARLIEAAVSRR